LARIKVRMPPPFSRPLFKSAASDRRSLPSKAVNPADAPAAGLSRNY
jgi:hypothetical protein